MPPLRAALYLRVSTDRQETECQRPEVEQLARVRGFEVVKVFEEKMSAAKVRPEYGRMMKEARRGAFDVIVVWAIDRFGRSMIGNVSDILDLDRVGVQESMVPEYVTHRMRRYVEAADLGKKGSCHIFRHTMATAMLDAGADVRFVQEMLGHASLATTQIYTHLSIGKLKKVHMLTHPSATMKGSKSGAKDGGAPADTAAPPIAATEDDRKALFGMLDAEDDEPDDGV